MRGCVSLESWTSANPRSKGMLCWQLIVRMSGRQHCCNATPGSMQEFRAQYLLLKGLHWYLLARGSCAGLVWTGLNSVAAAVFAIPIVLYLFYTSRNSWLALIVAPQLLPLSLPSLKDRCYVNLFCSLAPCKYVQVQKEC